MSTAAIRLLCTASLALLTGMPSLRAGHDLFTQLVASESKETGLARPHTPVSIGIPLPASANIHSLSNLVAVGTIDTQYSVLTRWPNGAIRWLGIDAIVDLPNDANSLSLQLTTGQAIPPSMTIASESESEIRLDTGEAVFIVPKDGTGFLSAIEVKGTRYEAETPFALVTPQPENEENVTNSWRIQVSKNGPVTASVEFRKTIREESNELTLLLRLSAAQQQTQLEIESSVLVSATNTETMQGPEISLATPPIAQPLRFENALNGMSFLSPGFSSLNDGQLICSHALSDARLRQEEDIPSPRILVHDSEPLPPGSLRQAHFFFETKPSEEGLVCLGSPLIGRATSIETYNDGLTFWDNILPYQEDNNPENSDLTETVTPTLESILPYLKAINESYVQYYELANKHVYSAWQRGLAGHEFADEGLAVWPFLVGDATLMSSYLNWGTAFIAHVSESSESRNRPTTITHLTRLLGTPLHDPAERVLLESLDHWLLPGREGNFDRQEAAAKKGPALVQSLYHLIQRIPPTDDLDDKLYDLMEGQLSMFPLDLRDGTWFAEAYRLTGDPEFLKLGQEWLDSNPAPKAQTLQHIIAAPLRHSIWRPLALAPISKEGSQAELQWTVPPRAERYRIKFAPQPIKSSLLNRHIDSISFFAAVNATHEPTPLKSGSAQTMTLPIPANVDLYYSARYLERGAALPPPDQIESESLTNASTANSATVTLSRSLLLIAVVTAILAGALMLRKRKQSPALTRLLLSAAAGALLACAPTTVVYEEDVTVNATPITEALSDQGNYRVTYTPTPNPVPLNEHFEMVVGVQHAQDEASPIKIEIHADMPSHGHGINTEPSILDLGEGQFEVKGLLFHMKGDWELYVDIINGPLRERATFPLTLQ